MTQIPVEIARIATFSLPCLMANPIFSHPFPSFLSLTYLIIINVKFHLCTLQGLEGNEEWMGSEEEPLGGFSWRGGFERDTTGILMWSEPFITTLPSEKEEVHDQAGRKLMCN